jgi:hypothetical protein
MIYFYTLHEYEFPTNTTNWKKELFVVLFSILLGATWPIWLIASIIIGILKFKNK